jgi:hypothetical protein
MTASAHLQLTDRILVALRADPPLVDGPIARGRAIVVAKAFTGAIGVRLARAMGQRGGISGVLQWQTAIVIECAKRVADGEDPNSAVDQLLQDIFSRINSQALPAAASTWTGDPEIAWDMDQQDPSVGAASLILRADHITPRSTLQPIT